MSLTKEEILDAVSSMSVMDIVQLVDMMEKKFGVSANAFSVAPSKEVPLQSITEEQTEFNVVLTAFGNSKIPVIKTVRSITGLGLKEAKELVESVPVTIKESINKIDADSMKRLLEESGASVEIK